jgi:small subunit ribosomal protein S16
MLAIRMRRIGAKKRPYFRIVVTDTRSAPESDFVEALGFYDPRSKPETLKVDRKRLAYWLEAGARPTDTVRTLVARHPAEPAPAPAEPAAEPAVTAEQPAS